VVCPFTTAISVALAVLSASSVTRMFTRFIVLQAWDFKRSRKQGVIRFPVWSNSEMASQRCAIIRMIFVPGLASYAEPVQAVKPRAVTVTATEIEESKATMHAAASQYWHADTDDEEDDLDEVAPTMIDMEPLAAAPPIGSGTGLELRSSAVQAPAGLVFEEGERTPASPTASPSRKAAKLKSAAKVLYSGSKSAVKAKRAVAANKALMESMSSTDASVIEEPAAQGMVLVFSEDNELTAFDVKSHERLWSRTFSSRLVDHVLIDRRQLWLCFADTSLLVMDAFTGIRNCAVVVAILKPW
jgi:hypothetical protein